MAAALDERASNGSRCSSLVFPDPSVEFSSAPSHAVRGFGDNLDRLDVAESPPQDAADEAMYPDIRFHRIHAQSHHQPTVGRYSKALHSPGEVPLEVTRVGPRPEVILVNEPRLVRPSHEPAQPPETVPILIPPEVPRRGPVAIRVLQGSD